MQPFELEGLWWLPGDKEKAIAGILRCNPEKEITLDLIGSFYELHTPQIDDPPLLIHGVSKSDSKLITLYKCQVGGTQTTWPGFTSISYHVRFVFISHHFKTPEDIQFFEFNLSYSSFEHWVNKWVFEVEEKKNEGKEFEGLTIKYNNPKTEIWNIDDFILKLEASAKLNCDWLTEAKVTNSLTLSVVLPSSIGLDEFFQRINYLIGNFLAFAIGSPVIPLKIEAKSDVATYDDSEGKSTHKGIQIIYRHDLFETDERKLQREYMLFTFEDIKDQFSTILNEWFKKDKVLRPVYDLYFSVLNSPRVFRTNHFLHIIQALESYHRRTAGGVYVNDWNESELYLKFSQLINTLPNGGFKESLLTKLQFLNEFSLRKRLNDIFERFDIIIKTFIKDSATLISDAVATRNFLIHFNEKLKDKAKSGGELYLLSTRLQHVLVICLMVEIGIPESKVQELIRRNQKIRWVAQ